MRRSWRRPARRCRRVARRRQLRDELVELGGDDRRVSSASVVARASSTAARRARPAVTARGEHEHAERDRDHRDEQARAQPARCGTRSRSWRCVGPRRLEPVADAAHRGDRGARRRASCAPGRCARRRCGRRRTSRSPTRRRGSAGARARGPGRSARKRSRSNSLVVNSTGSSSTRTSRRPASMVTGTGLHDLGRGAAVDPAQHRLHPCDELGGRERLREVVVAAELEPEHAVDLAVARGEEDHRDLRRLPQALAHLEAVDVGEPDVEHDEARPVGAHRFEARLAGRGLAAPGSPRARGRGRRGRRCWARRRRRGSSLVPWLHGRTPPHARSVRAM